MKPNLQSSVTLILSAMIAIWVIGCATTESGSRPKASEARTEKKPEVGMTKAQVVELFGKTDNVQESSQGETWIYNLNMGEMFIPFNFGYRPRTRIIHFDKNGVVTDWSYSK